MWIMVYSNGLRKSFWNLKCGSSSFSKKRIASCRSASRAKKPTCGLLWQHTCPLPKSAPVAHISTRSHSPG